MNSKVWNFKSLPELRDNNHNNQTVFILNEISDNNNNNTKVKIQEVENKANGDLKVPDNDEKSDLHRSHSVGFKTKKGNIEQIKHNNHRNNVLKIIQTSPNNEVKEIEVNVSNSFEEEIDSGLCSANEDTESHVKIVNTESNLVDEASSTCSFKTELKLKAKEFREKSRRRDASRVYRYKPTAWKNQKAVRHGSLLSEKCLYRNMKAKGFSYSSEFDHFRSFKHQLDDRLQKPGFEVCSEIKEEDYSSIIAEQDESSTNKQQITNMLGLQNPEQSASTKSIMNSLESIFHKKPNLNPNAAAATVIATAAAAASSTDDETLQKLIDIVMPPLLVSSNFDISNNEDVAELSLMMHQHLNEATANSKMDFNVLNRNKPDIEANEHIMRTCLGYLDYINKKHSRERQLQVIRNKISGVVLLTLVFLMIFGLGLIMSIYLVKSLTGIMKAKSEFLKISASIVNANQTFTDGGGGSAGVFYNIVNSTLNIDNINISPGVGDDFT